MATKSGNLARYRAQAEPYKAAAEATLRGEKDILQSMRPDDSNAGAKKLALAEEMLNLASQYVAMSGISQTLLKSKDEDALNNARKAVYKGIVYAEEVVTGLVDATFSEYKEKLEAIESVSPAQRYALTQKMGLAIDLVASSYANNTKWKWTFVELRGRFAAVAKNLVNLDQIGINADPRSPHYESTVYHLRLVKKLLALAAERFREKYELSSKSVEDFNKSLQFLGSLRRLCVLTGDRDEAETIKKKMDIWNSKLTADIRSKAKK